MPGPTTWQPPKVRAAVPELRYAPAPESTAPGTIRDSYGLYIGGQWVSSASATSFATQNPATEEKLAEVAYAEAADVDRAVRSARRGYEKYWRKLRPTERAKYV